MIMKDAYSISSITAKLVADGALSEEEQTDILAQESDAGKNDKLLHYITHKSPDTFYSFCRIVHSESEVGANVIQYLARELHSMDTGTAFADKVCKHAQSNDPYQGCLPCNVHVQEGNRSQSCNIIMSATPPSRWRYRLVGFLCSSNRKEHCSQKLSLTEICG